MALSEGEKSILDAFLAGYEPGPLKNECGHRRMTSAQIAEELIDMCELKVNDITDYMIEKGFVNDYNEEVYPSFGRILTRKIKK